MVSNDHAADLAARAAYVRQWRAANPELYRAQRLREKARRVAKEAPLLAARRAEREAKRSAAYAAKLAALRAARAERRAARASDPAPRRANPVPRATVARPPKAATPAARKPKAAPPAARKPNPLREAIPAAPTQSSLRKLPDPAKRLALARAGGYRLGRVLFGNLPAQGPAAIRPAMISVAKIQSDIERNANRLATLHADAA